ncbi:hypothetical protein [Acidilobus saccharovorans]|uniref:hypothetical protein n=1 Tax=Acidilobus saccharovorans TaxID=242703 RepID=UPI000ADCD699|nr:hypothetical protein [Acidilobus saccharovorans]
MYSYWEEMAIAAAMGAEHAAEPDHIVAMRLMRSRRDVLYFGALHGIGFLLLSVPLALAVIEAGLRLGFISVIEIIGYMVGMIFAVMLLYSSLMGKEMEISASGSGLAQGALAITPSKLLVLVMAIASGTYEGAFILLAFSAASSLVMPAIGTLASKVPANLAKILDSLLGVATLLFFLALLIKIF